MKARVTRPQPGLRARMLATHLVAAIVPAVLVPVLASILILVVAPSALVLLLLIVTAVLIGVGAAFATANLLYQQIAGPLKRASGTAGRLSRGQFSVQVQSSLPGTPGNTELNSDLEGSDDPNELVSALEELGESLHAAERRRTESFGEITHEIRTPVAILEGYFEGLLDGHIKPSDETWAMLHSEASRVHRLVEELQALSKYEARQAPPDLRSVNPGEIARAVLERLKLPFREKSLETILEMQKGLPLVLADPDHVMQVLVNLLTNALRYTPAPGTVTLSVSRYADPREEGGRASMPIDEVVFRVSDTGVGIAAVYIPHLFERFFRVDRSGSRSIAGHGLGLPVAKALVEAMGGKIWAESGGPGKGSTFSFTLLISAEPGAE